MQRKGGGGASSAGGRVVLVALCDKLPVPRLGLSLSRGRALPCPALPCLSLLCALLPLVVIFQQIGYFIELLKQQAVSVG